ncbi:MULTISPECIES: helix-turn-helix transcriptional regulator [unclassified Microbacterium]|uniref:helix-turn-helix domain-containing protein n=1 Tax=unclassified Microbacterium TaxID=2609290 RepID=UPI0010F7F562|nr:MULTISPECIES: helix-turn-helix transcriptional regulator [unclassified Microbacterium]
MSAHTQPHLLEDAAASRAVAPIIARTRSYHRRSDPVAYDCIRLIVVRDGSAILFSEFGQQPVKLGDVILLGANTLCGSEPEGHITVTTIDADTDYVIDQVFWQHVGILHDRLDAQDFAATIYTEPAQILRLGETRAGMLMPWLDELVALSAEGRPVETFYRMQALWFSVAHVIAPFIKTSQVRTSSTERATAWPTSPRIRRFTPLRAEARKAADLLRSEPERRWSVTDLANEVHLSKSQVGRLFVDAFGKSPIAYLTMLRTERMAALLRTTDASITAIAQEVGWSDPDFAARQFRRSVGVTPSDYRTLSRVQAPHAAG